MGVRMRQPEWATVHVEYEFLELLPGTVFSFVKSLTWQGMPTLPVFITDMERQTWPWPWPLALVEEMPYRGGALYARTDGLNRLAWLWHRASAPARRAALSLRTRVVLTLMVWGLAYCRAGDVPAWRDIGRRRP